MPLRHVHSRSPSTWRIVLAGFAAAALLILVSAPTALAAAPKTTWAPSRPSSSDVPPACATQTVVLGVMPDLRTVTVTQRDSAAPGRQQGAVAAGRLPFTVRAVAALDPSTFLAVDSSGALRLGTLDGSSSTGFTLTSTVIARRWHADQLAYDGAGHLFAISGKQLSTYSIFADGNTLVVGPARTIAGTYNVAHLFAVGSDQLVAISAAGTWTLYTVTATVVAPVAQGRTGSPGLATTARPLGTAAQYRNVIPAGPGAFYVQTRTGALLGATLPLDSVAPALTAADLVAIAKLNAGAAAQKPPSKGSEGTPSLDPKASTKSKTATSQTAPVGSTGARSIAGNLAVPTGPTSPKGPKIAANAIDARGWTQPLLSAAPSACGSTIPQLTDPHRAVGLARVFNGFVAGWCTEGASAMFQAASGYWMDIRGNAWRWADSARAAGWTVSATPQPDSVVVFQPNVEFAHGIAAGGLGHVAWVDLVAQATDGAVWFHVWEMNGPAGRGQWDQVWAKYETDSNTTTGRPNMQFVLAPLSAESLTRENGPAATPEQLHPLAVPPGR